MMRPWVWFGCLVLIGACAQAQSTPLPLGASDLAPDARMDALKRTSSGIDLREAFQAETNAQLDWSFEMPPAPTELEQLKDANEALRQRVAELERRLAAVEAQLEVAP